MSKKNLDFEGDGRISVNVDDLLKSPKVREQVEVVREIAAGYLESHVEGYDCIRADCQRLPGADCLGCIQRWSKVEYVSGGQFKEGR